MSNNDPPEHLLADNGRGDRMVLVQKYAEWHKSQPLQRHISYYINPTLLELPAKEVYPKEWSDPRAKTIYRSLASGMRIIEDYDLGSKQMKKVFEAQAFLFGYTTITNNAIYPLFAQFRGRSAYEPEVDACLSKVCARAPDIALKMRKDVGTAIFMYIMQDKRFCSQEYGPLPKFNTSKQRVAWFLMILEEKPVLCMLFVFAIFRSSIDVPFIFSEWSYGGMLDSLKVKLQKMIRLRLATLLNLIFRGKFNIARTQRRVDTEKYCTWIRKNVQREFNTRHIKKLKLRVEDIPVLQTWPKLKRPTPWWKHLGGDGVFDESDGEDDDEDGEESGGDSDVDGHEGALIRASRKQARGAKSSSSRKRARIEEA